MVLFKLFDVIDVRMADILDILLVSIILYYVFLLFRGTRAVQMIVGGLLLIVAWLIAQWWELRSITWLLSNLTGIGIVALVILFQPEIRSALTRIGQMISRADLRQLFFHSSGLDEVTESITSAVQDLAKNRVGALIVLEKRVGLRNYEETGEILNARISSRLLRALFFPNSALHDGAVLLNSQRIVAAGCIRRRMRRHGHRRLRRNGRHLHRLQEQPAPQAFHQGTGSRNQAALGRTLSRRNRHRRKDPGGRIAPFRAGKHINKIFNWQHRVL